MIIQEIKEHMQASLPAGIPSNRKTITAGLLSPSGGTAPSPTSKSLLSISEISHFNLSKIDFGEKNVAFEVLFQLYAGTYKGLHGICYIISLHYIN